MRDNARRLLTILTVILALWLVLGFWPLSIGNRVDLPVCAILLAGGAARSGVSVAGQSASQRSEIVLPPGGFSGAVVLVCGGYRRSVSRAFGARQKPVTAGIYGETARSNCRGWRSTSAAARPALVCAGFRAAGGGTGAPPLRGASGAVAARLAAEYRSVPNLAKRSAAGVERVLGDAARQPGPRKAAGLPSRRRGLGSGCN